jgi:hypothetical protein
VTAALAAAAALALGAPAPRVTMITDSVAGALYWVTDARQELAAGFDFRLETKTCRRLVDVGCPAYGEEPESALALIERLGPKLGRIVVVAVGYNDTASDYPAGIDEAMRALVASGVRHVVWLTLSELHEPWPELNDEIRAAAPRWPQLTVADWAAASAGQDWFADAPHLTAYGAVRLAEFLRPFLLDACGCPGIDLRLDQLTAGRAVGL